MYQWKTLSRALVAGAFLAGAGACADGTGNGGTTSLSVRLTDAPGDVVAAVVTISEIYLQGEGRTVLLDQPVTTDLLTLTNDVLTLVDGVDVPEGRYQELRFVITGGYLEVEENGGTAIYASSPDYAGLPAGAVPAGGLQMPSYGASGLKVKMEGALDIAGDQQILLVDFDVAQSFGHATGSGDWVMDPVITGADFGASAAVHASLVLGDGVVLPDLSGAPTTLAAFEAVLTNGGGSAESAALTDGDGDGTFEADFLYLLPGDYTVTFSAPAGMSATFDPVSIPLSLGSGQTASAASEVTAASAE